MTSLSRRITFPPGFPADRLGWRIQLARLVLALERILPRLWPAFGFGGLYLAGALSGLFQFVAWPAQALLLAAAITAMGLSLEHGFRDFRWPRGLDGARRLERDSGLVGRPLSERNDVMAGGAGDAIARALWQLHKARALPRKLHLALPRVTLAERDPHGLRWYLVIALAAGLLLARGHIGARLARAFDSGFGAAATIDAWVSPPPYTGLPLISLHAGQSGPIGVPVGSTISLRVHGAPRTPGLMAGPNNPPRFSGHDGEYASTFTVVHDGNLRVQVGGEAIGKWNLHAIPDMAPTIAFTAKPKATAHLATGFAFKGHDDYGITKMQVTVKPHEGGGKTRIVDLPLPEASAKTVTMNTYVDLTGDPYAGLVVDARLKAWDGAGHSSLSAPVTFKLPARVFTDPLARALVEQRQHLATSDKAGAAIVGETLDALSIGPGRFYENRNDIFLAIRNAFFGVKQAQDAADYTKVEDLLWQTALKLERGGLLSAAEELRKLQQMLAAALAAGAPQDVINELLKRYDEAMQNYLRTMKANPGAANQQPLPPDAKLLGENDIQTLMNMIQKLAEAGDRKRAAELLGVLQSMLENLRLSQGGGTGQGAQNQALNRQMKTFGHLMGQQRSLLDKTFRQGQGQGAPKDGGPQGLARQQGDLEQQLQDALKGMDPKAAESLKQAGRAMDQARRDLARGDMANAGNAQNQALDALSKGAQALAQAAQNAQQGQAGNRDPLGRGNSVLGDSGVKIPAPDALAEAHKILEELRRRSAQLNRPEEERDYLDRLLKLF